MYENPAGERDSTSRDASYGVTGILLVACACSSACATVINGATQRVAVMSDPPGAQLYINDTPVGVTPAFIDVSRRDAVELRFEKDGCDPAVLTLKRSRRYSFSASAPVYTGRAGAWRSKAPVRAGRRCTAMHGGPRPDGQELRQAASCTERVVAR